MREPSEYVGVDVAKGELVVARADQGETTSYPNTAAGHQALLHALTAAAPCALLVVEATGGYERGVVAALGSAGLPVVVVNPRQVRDFAKATGQLAKTDAIDAHVLAAFAARVQPAERPLPSEAQDELRDFLARQHQVQQMLLAEKTRLQQALGSKARQPLRRQITRHITFLERELQMLDHDLDALLRASPLWREQDDLLQSVTGIGRQTARLLLGLLPELGHVSAREIGKLAGLAPINHDSGTMRGRRHIRGGRPRIRAVLYMATLAAIRYNPIVRTWYERLLAARKPKKVAIIACMRHLLVVLNAMLKTHTRWQAPKPITA